MNIDSAIILAVSSCDDPSEISTVYSEVSNLGSLCLVPTGLPLLTLTCLITFTIFLFPSWSGNSISAPRYKSNMSSLLRSFVSRDKSSISGRSILDRSISALSPRGLHMPLILDTVSLHWQIARTQIQLKHTSHRLSLSLTFSDNPLFYSWSQYSQFCPVSHDVLYSFIILYQYHLVSISLVIYLCGGKHQAILQALVFPNHWVYPNTNISHRTQSPFIR